jgi:prepilin peptidase CpaA
MDGVIPLLVVAIGVVVSTFTDVTRFKVYNRLTFPIFFGGLAYGLILGGLSGLGFAMAGAFTGFGILIIPYLMGGLGAGDVKFVMAMGSWIGASALLPAIIIGCLVLFIYYGVVIARQRGFAGLMMNMQLMMMRMSCFGKNLAMTDNFESVQSAANSPDSENRGRLIPFSAMMSIGIVAVLIIANLLKKMPQ